MLLENLLMDLHGVKVEFKYLICNKAAFDGIRFRGGMLILSKYVSKVFIS
jgi:hypothetical protein